MSVILVHIGCIGPYITSLEPPPHLDDCIEQYFTFNDDDLYVLTDKSSVAALSLKHPKAEVVAIEDYHSDKVSRFESVYNYQPNEFWTVATTRLMYTENFLRANSISHICEFANDILIYFNIAEYNHVFETLYANLALTPCGPTHIMDGFMYIDNYQSLEHMTSFFIDVISDLGLEGVKIKYGLDMVNEMTLMKCYVDDHPDRVGRLPILPFGEYSENYDDFGAVFDPASWGQYVGGTRTKGPGAKAPSHHIGQVLIEHPEYEVVWETEDNLNVPYFKYDGNLVKLNTLHIHSKNTQLYMSERREN